MNKQVEEKPKGAQILWTFEHKKTEKQIQKWMTYDESVEWVKNNPKYFKVLCTNHGDAVKLGIKKPPSDFMTGVIEPMMKKVPGFKGPRKFKIPKQI